MLCEDLKAVALFFGVIKLGNAIFEVVPGIAL